MITWYHSRLVPAVSGTRRKFCERNSLPFMPAEKRYTSQPTISTFFSSSPSNLKPNRKRLLTSPIDLTVNSDDDESPPHKKSRTFNDSPTTSTRPTGAAEQWRFIPPSSPEKPVPQSKPRTEADDAARKKRHELFKKKLLEQNNPFLRPESGFHEDPIHVASEDERDKSVDDSQGSGDESDETFKKLTKMFSNKSKGKKGKAPAVSTPTKRPKKKVEEIGPSGQTYTPLEQQVLELKRSYPGVLLMVEVGYKYRFFGDDAKVAAKELGIVCFPDRNFTVASIPVHRRDVHLKKLLSQGHKVGIVEQVETAALKKASDNRNTPFIRKLTHMYTAATYVDGLDSVDDLERYSPPPLMCLMEEPMKGGMGADERVSIGMITICPSTGDVVWDQFEDSHMRIELETRLVHTRPTELLLPDTGLTKPTEKMLTYFTGVSMSGDHIRTERFSEVMSYTEAFEFLSDFYLTQYKSRAALKSFASGKLIAAIADFPRRVVIVLAQAVKHLKAFSIADVLMETKYFTKFSTKVHMLLSSCTLTNLEIYRNETDFTTKGSLMWILDRTKTKFGARLLKSWVGRPLVDKVSLQERIDAVEEIISSSSEKLVTIRQLLKTTPDLAKGLCRIQYGKCTPQELAVLLPAFNKIATAFEGVDTPGAVGFKSILLNDIVSSLPRIKKPLQQIMSSVSLKKASEGRKDTMWSDPHKYPSIADIDECIQMVGFELMEELKHVRKVLKKPSLTWASVAGEEYLVEIKKSENRVIPPSWIIVSRTKFLERYQTPKVKKKLEELAQHRETLKAESDKAYLSFLGEIAENHYGGLRDVVNKLAVADCLLSLANLAAQQGDNYVRPQFTDDDTLEIEEGRHPMIEALRSDPFVPNTVFMGGDNPRHKIITGPNMGGKSSSVRMIALIAIMAQIGSYVPAKSVKLGMLDSIHTRMGASDDLLKGRSTFMVEMTETSDILRTATPNSLVILDELGRGTSTFDGMSIANAVLQHLVETIKSKTLFITHYPLVAMDLEKRFPQEVQNLHMQYREESRIDGSRDITFLYRLTSGLAQNSFGVECARLAGLPERILHIATDRSSRLQVEVEQRSSRNKARRCAQLLNQCLSGAGIATLGLMEELQTLVSSISISPSSIETI